MVTAFLSEIRKLRRRSILVGGLAMVVFSAALGYFGTVRALNPGRFGEGLVTSALVSNEGLSTLLSRGAAIVNVIAFIIVASSVTAEYTQGTLRNLLVRQPSRLRLLAGKFLALLLYAWIAATLAYVVASAVVVATAGSRGLDTSAWGSALGVQNVVLVWVDMLIGTTAWAVFALFAGVIFRSAAAAIGVGLAYVLVGETIIAELWDSAPNWLFGRLVDGGILAGQGVVTGPAAAGPSYAWALGVVAVYVAGFLAVSGYLFRTRDVGS